MKKYLKKNPPINEDMIKTLMMQMGRKPNQKQINQMMKAMEECTIEAAISGNYGLLMEAFALNPLIPMGESAKSVLDELLIAHKKYLPQFHEKISDLASQNITIKDPVINELIKNEH